MSRARTLAAALLSASLLALLPARSPAQASAYVPLGDPAYALIDALVARGELGALSLLERPYTAAQIRTALARDAGTARGERVTSWREALARAAARFSPEPPPSEAAERPAPPPPDDESAALLPPGDAGYVYADALIARGLLAPLASTPRPYTLHQLRVAIAAADTTRLDSASAGWLRELRLATERAAGSQRAVADAPARPPGESGELPMVAEFAAELFATAQSSGRRELMRADTADGAFLGVRARGAVVAGPLVAAVRGSFDPRLKDDPEYTGRRDRGLVGRFDDAYVALQGSVGELFVGRAARSWGPARADGFLVGAYAYSYDHLYLRLGRPALHASAILTRLDDFKAGGDTLYQRFLAAHRVAVRWRGLEAAIEESLIYGGRGRTAEAAFANPFNVYTAALFNGEGGDGNSLVTLDLALRSRGAGVFAAQLMVDDLQIDDCSGGCEEPPSFGYTLSAEGLPMVGDQRWFALYTRVANLAYRTPQPWETYTMRGVGLGRGFSDYDELRLGLDLALPSALPSAPPLRAYVARQRQGAGDYRLPYPAVAQYASTPTFLTRPVTTVVRAALSGSGSFGALAIGADVGYNRVRPEGASPTAAAATGWEGRFVVTLESPRLRVVQ